MNLRRDVFQAIADPTRRAILLLVASQALTAGAIAANFDTARPTVSKHLQILTECELLEQKQTGREIYYHINAKNMKEWAGKNDLIRREVCWQGEDLIWTQLSKRLTLFLKNSIIYTHKDKSMRKLTFDYRILLGK